MRFFKSIGVIFLSILLIVGCSSKPSETEVKQEIEQMIQENSNGLIKLIDFKKTNGVEQQIPLVGGTYYKMEWVATLGFTDDCIWTRGFRTITDKTDKQHMQYMRENPWALSALDEKIGKKGEQVNLTGKTQFEKTENGWRRIGNSY